MTKEEFLSTLRGRLTGNMSQAEVESHIAFYASYIDEQLGIGKTMEDIINDIGEPRIIAKTLMGSGSSGPTVVIDDDNYGRYSEGESDAEKNTSSTGSKIKRTAIIAAVIIGALVIIGLVVSLVLGLLWILAPVILCVVIIGVVLKMVNKK